MRPIELSSAMPSDLAIAPDLHHEADASFGQNLKECFACECRVGSNSDARKATLVSSVQESKSYLPMLLVIWIWLGIFNDEGYITMQDFPENWYEQPTLAINDSEHHKPMPVNVAVVNVIMPSIASQNTWTVVRNEGVVDGPHVAT